MSILGIYREVKEACESDGCKKVYPVFQQVKYLKGVKPANSSEVQPHLSKLVLKRDKYTCQICGAKEVQLHCHHITGVMQNPVESADVNNCITLCKDYHKSGP